MKKFLVVILLGFVVSLFGDDFENGLKAYGQNDFMAAKNYFHKACDSGELGGCINLGILYVKGEGVKQDYFKAVELYKKACDRGALGAVLS